MNGAPVRGLCPVCEETPLRVDNEAGVCGYCQVGIDRSRHHVAGRREIALAVMACRGDAIVERPLFDAVPERDAGGGKTHTFTRRALRHQVKADKELPGLRAAELRAELARPQTREQCAQQPRPCPWVGCRFHLFLDVTRGGGIVLNHPGVELEDLEVCCALDVADDGGATLERVGELMGVTRERIRQLETSAIAAMKIALGPENEP